MLIKEQKKMSDTQLINLVNHVLVVGLRKALSLQDVTTVPAEEKLEQIKVFLRFSKPAHSVVDTVK